MSALLPIDDARERVRSAVPGRLGEESLPVEAALDRVLAADVVAAGDIPPFSSAAMDGYALASVGGPERARVVGEARAGAPYDGSLQADEAVRISTGAAVPEQALSVVRQEDVVARGGTIETQVTVPPGANIRRPGEDMRAGMVIVAEGTRLGPAELGAAVAAGAGRLTVARRPHVAVVCTGDELRPPGAPLGPGQIHNSNGPMLRALVERAGAVVSQLAQLSDEADATESTLAAVLEECEVLIVSGGVSVGPHDHVKPALGRLGVAEHFWGVALQPGKPTWFGSRGPQLVFALPGNPVSAAVTFSLFTRVALDALLGARPRTPVLPEAELGSDVRRNPAREQAIRVRLEFDGGRAVAVPTGAQDSHLFTSLLRADALAIIPSGSGTLAAGARVRLEPAPA